jgi:hypothetical protein
MPETTTPSPTTETGAAKATRTRAAINQAHVAELELAGQLAATAAKAAYAGLLAGEEIDAAFLTGLRARIAEANTLIGSANNNTAGKQATTRQEKSLQKDLLARLQAIQTRAKRKYSKPGDPMRAKYFIGKAIDGNRAMLETSSQTILQNLATDTLPGMKPEDVTGLQAAREAYLAVQTDQAGGQADATTDRAKLEAAIKEVAELRRQIQYAADTLWPARTKANSGIRAEFRIPTTRALK